MKRILTLAALVLCATFVQADFPYSGTFVRAIPQAVAADDSDVAFLIKYIGSETSATVAVAADGNLTFLAGGSAVTEFECPTSAPLGGVLDISDTACDTMGEIVDIINGSTSWRAYLLDGFRDDAVGANTLLTIGATAANTRAGLAINIDTDAIFLHSRTMGSCRTFDCLAPTNAIPANPNLNRYQVFQSYNVKSTYGSGTSIVSIYSRKRGRNSETNTLLYTAAGGATTVYSAVGATTWPNGLIGPPGEEIVFRLVNSAAMASLAGQYNALQFQLP